MKRAITITYILDVPDTSRLNREDTRNWLIYRGLEGLYGKNSGVAASVAGFSHEPIANAPVRSSVIAALGKAEAVKKPPAEEPPVTVAAKEVAVTPPKWKEGEFDGNCQ
jgi:hypothetical protein